MVVSNSTVSQVSAQQSALQCRKAVTDYWNFMWHLFKIYIGTGRTRSQGFRYVRKRCQKRPYFAVLLPFSLGFVQDSTSWRCKYIRPLIGL